MKIGQRCISCLAREAVKIAENSTPDPELQARIVEASLAELRDLSSDQSAPEVGYRMHLHARRLTGITDSYRELKATYNSVAAEIAGTLREQRTIADSLDPFDAACRIAIAGNIIDFSAGLTLNDESVRESVKDSLTKPLFGVGSEVLKAAVAEARSILYLADNSGEIVFDRFLIELLPRERVTLVVKGGPIVNDATMEDAIGAGLTELVHVIDNGHDAQGTVLAACSGTFREAFGQADLIISKGRANFETLSDVPDKQIFFLLRAKCQTVADAIGCELMSFVLTSSQALRF